MFPITGARLGRHTQRSCCPCPTTPPSPGSPSTYSRGRKSGTLQRKSHLCIPFLGIALPQSQFPHSCVCERSWKYINLSQIYDCRNWKTENYNSVLEITVSILGKHKREPDIYIGFSPAFLCSVHHNFVRDGIDIVKESAWACTPHPHQAGLIFPS